MHLHRSTLRTQLGTGLLYAGLIYGSALFVAACSDTSNSTAPRRTAAVRGPRLDETCEIYEDCGGCTPQDVQDMKGTPLGAGVFGPARPSSGDGCGYDGSGSSPQPDDDWEPYEVSNGCDPTTSNTCTLQTLSDPDTALIMSEARRLTSQWPSTSVCYQIGQAIQSNVGLIRWTPYAWYDSRGGTAYGDTHPVGQLPAEDGRVHIAQRFAQGSSIAAAYPDGLRPNDLILHTVRHEFAHFIGAAKQGFPGADPADPISDQCAGSP